jgi:hypothetical protein
VGGVCGRARSRWLFWLVFAVLVGSCTTTPSSGPPTTSVTGTCVEPPVSERTSSSSVTLTVDPNPVTAGSVASLSIDSRLPGELVDGVATWWQCWNGTEWVDTYLVERDWGNGPTTLKIEPGVTTTIPALGLAVPNTAAILIPDVAPGTYRIRDELGVPSRVEDQTPSETDKATALVIVHVVAGDAGTSNMTTTPTETAATPTVTTVPEPVTLGVELFGPGVPASDRWREVVTIHYGEAENQVGLDQLAGVGPEFGALAADGTWWILDSQKRRVAVFDSQGGLVQAFDTGRVAEQFPTVLDDGTFVAIAFERALTIGDGRVETWQLADSFSPLVDDGSVLYGRSSALYPRLSVTDSGVSLVSGVEWLKTRGGVEFRVDANDETGQVAVVFNGDPPVRVRLVPYLADDPNTQIAVAPLYVVSGVDNTVSLVLVGADNGNNVAALVSITPDGTLDAAVPLPPGFFFDSVEPLFGHLVVQPGTSSLYLVTTDKTGLHAYQFTGPEADGSRSEVTTPSGRMLDCPSDLIETATFDLLADAVGSDTPKAALDQFQTVEHFTGEPTVEEQTSDKVVFVFTDIDGNRLGRVFVGLTDNGWFALGEEQCGQR